MTQNMMKTAAFALCMAISVSAYSTAHADSMMKKDTMEKSDAMMMDKSMEKDTVVMDKMADKQQISYSENHLTAAMKSGEPFFVAFHKKGCPDCARQQDALNSLYADPAYDSLKVLVVDYSHDTNSLKKFNVGRQTTLILYKGDKELSRSEGLISKTQILTQLNKKPTMMNQ